MIKYNFVNFQGADDGVFWIAFEDVLTFFDCIDICKVGHIVIKVVPSIEIITLSSSLQNAIEISLVPLFLLH